MRTSGESVCGEANPKFFIISLRGSPSLNTKFQETEELLITSYAGPSEALNSCFPRRGNDGFYMTKGKKTLD